FLSGRLGILRRFSLFIVSFLVFTIGHFDRRYTRRRQGGFGVFFAARSEQRGCSDQQQGRPAGVWQHDGAPNRCGVSVGGMNEYILPLRIALRRVKGPPHVTMSRKEMIQLMHRSRMNDTAGSADCAFSPATIRCPKIVK